MGSMGGSPAKDSLSLLGAMIDPRGERELEWSAVDLREMTRHALTSDWGVASTSGGGCLVLSELLAEKTPPRDRLDQARRVVKAAMDGDGGALPRDVSKVLYVAIVAKARISGHTTISRLDEREFVRLARWGLAQSWVADTIREVLRVAMRGKRIRRDGE